MNQPQVPGGSSQLLKERHHHIGPQYLRLLQKRLGRNVCPWVFPHMGLNPGSRLAFQVLVCLRRQTPQAQYIARGSPVYILLNLRQQLIAYPVARVVKGIVGGILHIGQIMVRQPFKDTVPVHVQQRPDNPASPVDDPLHSKKTASPEQIVENRLHLVPAVVGHRDFHGTETAASQTAICRISICRTSVRRTAMCPISVLSAPGPAGPVLAFPVQGLLLQCLIAQKTPGLLLRHALFSRQAAHIYL